MFSPVRPCPRCGGTGYRPLSGPFHVRCRPCKGTGQQIRMAARLWWAIRYGKSEE